MPVLALRLSMQVACALAVAPATARDGSGGGGNGGGGHGDGGGSSGSGSNAGHDGSQGNNGSGSAGQGSHDDGASHAKGDDGAGKGGHAFGSTSVTPSDRRDDPSASDHDMARDAVAQGFAIPLARVLPTVKASVTGDVLDVKLRRIATGALVYDVTVLSTDGAYRVVVVDAKRNRILTGENR